MIKIILSILLFSTVALASEITEEVPRTSYTLPTIVAQNKNVYVRLNAMTSPRPGNLIGGGLTFGKQWGLFTLDFQVLFASSSYDAVSPQRGLAQVDDAVNWPVASQPGSEIGNTLRTPSTPFATMLYGPGVGVHGKALSRWFSNVSEYGKVSLLYGSMADGTNSISFTAYVFSAEAGLYYQLEPTGNWALNLSGSMNAGEAYSSANKPGLLGRIPVLFGSIGLGLSRWF